MARLEFRTVDEQILILNHQGEYLGHISYYERWNKYVFEGDTNCVFDVSCLKEIIKKLDSMA